MSTTHKKNAHDEDKEKDEASGGGGHKRQSLRSVAITFTLPAHIDDKGADDVRGHLQVEVVRWLAKKLGKVPADLIVH